MVASARKSFQMALKAKVQARQLFRSRPGGRNRRALLCSARGFSALQGRIITSAGPHQLTREGHSGEVRLFSFRLFMASSVRNLRRRDAVKSVQTFIASYFERMLVLRMTWQDGQLRKAAVRAPAALS